MTATRVSTQERALEAFQADLEKENAEALNHLENQFTQTREALVALRVSVPDGVLEALAQPEPGQYVPFEPYYH